MADAVSALGGRASSGFVDIAEIGPIGMITLRADLGSPAVARAVKAVTGCAMPGPRRIVQAEDCAVGWMSPDEVLLVVGYADAARTVSDLSAALDGQHHLVTDVSDARAVFRLEGAKAEQVLMKLCPVDMARLDRDELRRTRAAQVAAAFWRSGPEEFTLVSFRSVAGYVMNLLEVSSRTDSEIF